jgi:hypothetical protein
LVDRVFKLSALTAVALVASCDGPDASKDLQRRHPAAAASGGPDEGRSGVRLALLRPSGDMLMASLEGTLQAEGPCLYIVGAGEKASRTLPAFHIAGLRWDPATRKLHAGRATLLLGQRVILGGGEPADPGKLDWVQAPDPSCDTSHLFMAGSIAAAEE